MVLKKQFQCHFRLDCSDPLIPLHSRLAFILVRLLPKLLASLAVNDELEILKRMVVHVIDVFQENLVLYFATAVFQVPVQSAILDLEVSQLPVLHQIPLIGENFFTIKFILVRAN